MTTKTPERQQLEREIRIAGEKAEDYWIETEEDLFFIMGKLVPAGDRWHYYDDDDGQIMTLPPYIQNREDGIDYLTRLTEYFGFGREEGRQQAKREFRSWFKED